MADYTQNDFCGQWIHSFEEDDAGNTVYRAHGFPFKRSRGRSEINVHSDGTVINTSPGRTDVPETTKGTWHLEQEQLIIDYADGSAENFTIKEVSPQKLVMKKT